MLLRNNSNAQEEHNTGTDRYLVTYADLITLLLGLFVILYAASQVDEEKYKEFTAALSSYFTAGKSSALQGGDGVLKGNKKGLPEPIFMNAEKSLDEIYEQTGIALAEYIDNGRIEIRRTGDGIRLILPEKLLFKSGKAEIQPGGIIIIDTLASILRGIKWQIDIEGHTDSDPIRTFRYESNWHLSSARALNVGWKLIRKGVPESNLSLKSFGSQRPVADNMTNEGKAQNRRVEITISDLPPNAPSDEGYSELDTLE